VEMGCKDPPDGDPVDARALHRHFVHMVGEQQIEGKNTAD